MPKLPGLTKDQLAHYIKDALPHLWLWSPSAENLILGTCAQESLMGKHLVQMNGGPGRGVGQNEPATLECILKESDMLRRLNIDLPADNDMLIYDIRSAIIIIRLKYSMFKEPLPVADDIQGMARYWKKYYNTSLGKGTEDEFIKNYNYYIGE